MRRVSRPSCDDGPLLEEQETEGQRQLHSLLLQQLHTDVDIDSCVAKRRCFAPAALYRPFGEQAAGVRSLSQFQALQDGERELVRLRELGLTESEIQLWQSRDLKEAAEQRCGVSAAPAAKQQRLQVIRDKMEARAQLLSRPQRFAASRPLSRREMEIERALFQGSDRLGFLSALYHRDAESQGEQQGASSSDPMDSIYREVLSQDAPAGQPPASAADTSQTAATNLSQHSQRDGAPSQSHDGQSQSSQRGDGKSQSPQRHDGQSQSSQRDDGKSQSPQRHDGQSQSSQRDDGKSQSPQRHDGHSQSPQRHDGQSQSSQRNDGQLLSSQRHDSQSQSLKRHDGQSQSSQRHDGQSQRHDGQSQSSQRDSGQSETTDVGSDLRGERMSSSESNLKRANVCGQMKLHLTQPIGSLRGEPEVGSGSGSGGPLTVRGQIQAPSDEEILQNRESEEGIRSIPRFRSYEPGSPSQVLCVKNLSTQASVAQLVALFSRFQERHGPPVLYRLLTGRLRGQAFITLPDADVAQKALQLVHGYRLLGKPLVVEFGRRRKEEEKHKEEEVQEHKE